MLLRQIFESDTKHITFVFGRLNPPTRGHEQLLDTAAAQGGEYKIFVSQTQDKKKNPLDYTTKIKFIREMFPKHADNVVEDSSLNTIMKIASYLYDQGYNAATFVAGSDRLEDMKKLLEAYNGVEGKAHGFYKFEVLDFVSSGEREDGAEGVAGISASGARTAAVEGDLEAFKEATGAGELAKPLYAAVRKGMGINESIEESLDEAISPEEAIRSIVSTADSITKVYGDLKTMAEKWVYNNGTLNGFHRNAAGVGKRWYDKFFWNNMDNDLRLLMAKNPKAAGKLRDFFDVKRDDKGHVSFTTIGRSLPRILNHVGEQMNNKDLKRFAAEWFRKHKDYEDYLGRVEAEVNDEEDDSAPAPKQPKDNVVGRQNAAAEDMVNQILRSIDKKAAGEIRNAIAREPNKLQALQRELAKRNIKVGESLDEDWRKKLAALGMAGMMGASGAAGAADRDTETKTDPVIATIVIDGETKRLDLTPKGFTDVRDAEKWLDKFMRDRGIMDWQGKIERGEPGTGRYQRLRITGFGDVNEGKFRKRDIEEKLIPNEKLNDLKSKYLPDWEMLDHRILQAKYVAKDHRHAEDFVSYINKVSEEMDHFAEVTQDVAEVTVKTTTFDVKGLTILDFKLASKVDKFAERDEIEQVRMQGNFGMHENIQESPIEMDPADPMDPMIYGHDKANPGKLKYRMARAAGQLKDLAARVDGATPEQWQRMAQQFDELKMNMEQIRHALEELGKVRKKGGIRSRGITV